MGQWIKDKIFGFADGIIDGFKSAFGIHSPSTVMRDSVGKYLAEGIGEGFMDELPTIAEDAREALTNLDLGAPKVGIDTVAELIELPPLEVEVPDITLPKPENLNGSVPHFDDDRPDSSRPQPMVADDAVMAIATQQILINKSDAAPSTTSDIINNQYTYNNTVNNNDASTAEPRITTLNAQFIVGEEVVAEGVLDIVDNEIDERQGLRVQMKRRGVTT